MGWQQHSILQGVLSAWRVRACASAPHSKQGQLVKALAEARDARDRTLKQLKEERMDAVKEWMTSRGFPHKLFVRVRKYFEFYYTRKSAFDEEDIISKLTPALYAEVTRILLRESLGHFPLFAVLGLEFQQAIYPRLKPVAYANMDILYHKGEESSDMFFLRKGAVDVLAGSLGTEVLYRITQGQYFGEEVLVHQRRGSTVVSNGWTEMWSLSREVLDEVIRDHPHLLARFDEFVVSELDRKRRLHQLSYRILIGISIDPERRAALILQKAWTKLAANHAKKTSHFAFAAEHTALHPPSLTTMVGSLKSMPGAHSSRADEAVSSPAASAAITSQLKDIQLQLGALRREVHGQATVSAAAAFANAQKGSQAANAKLKPGGSQRRHGPSPPAQGNPSGERAHPARPRSTSPQSSGAAGAAGTHAVARPGESGRAGSKQQRPRQALEA